MPLPHRLASNLPQVLTAEQLYEEFRPRLRASDAWMAERHPQLLAAADAMVEALGRKLSYDGGVSTRAAALATHLRDTDPLLRAWLERQGLGGKKGAATALEYLATTMGEGVGVGVGVGKK